MDTNLRAVKLLRGGVPISKRKRKKYTDEFKEEAVKLVTEQQYKVTEASRNLDIHHSLLRRWIKGCSPSPKSGSGEIVKLKAEVKQLKGVATTCT